MGTSRYGAGSSAFILHGRLAWLGLAVAIVAYVLAAKLANREMDRVFLIENLKNKVEPPKRQGLPPKGGKR